MNFKKVALHPATIKYLNLGHFWVTDDSFTKKFPKEDRFLIGIDSVSKKEVGLFLNDPEHKNVKARFFSKDVNINFEEELKNRISTSIQKRFDSKLIEERENLLLINGESDGLPGLMVLILHDQILIQYYALFWKYFEKLVINLINNSMIQIFPQLKIKEIWIQERNFEQTKAIRSINNSKLEDYELLEFGIKYKMKINANYDYGLYTDMSAIRKNLIPYLKNKKNGLNLYCYTGAFTLFSLKHSVQKMTSVDLSEKYLTWLDENLKANPDLHSENHRAMNMSVTKAIDVLKNENSKFDLIFSDPPSSSSDGDKRENSFTAYETLLPSLLDLLTPDGALIVFLNTHQISWNKFEEKLKTIIANSKWNNQVIIGKRFKLAEDYLPTKGFHEGDYLKGFLIEFKNKKESL